MAFTEWSYKRILTDANATAVTDHVVRVLLTSSNFDFAHANADGSDLRFWDATDATELPYWVESYDDSGETAEVWVRVADVANTLEMYYGNASAESASSIRDAFPLGDDFESYNKAVLIGAPPMFATDTCRLGSTIYAAAFNSSTQRVDLYQTTDNGGSWSVAKNIYAASSGRSHCYCDTDGDDTIWVAVKAYGGEALYVKKYTVSTDTLDSEVTIASGLSGVTDSKALYVSGAGASATLLCFARIASGGNHIIRCYRSTDGGANWSLYSTPHTESTASISSIEDIDAIIAGNGDILLGWEREVTEKGEASCRQRRSTDGGATWGSETTVVDNATYDDEGGHYFLDDDGALGAANALYYVYGSNKAGGASYDENQLYRLKSTDHGATWGDEKRVWESHSNVEPVGEFTADGRMLLMATKQYDPSGSTSLFRLISFHAVESADEDWSDRGWSQDAGLAYTQDVDGETVVRVESVPRTATRGFFSNLGVSGADYVFRARMRSGASGIVDFRPCFRYSNENNHYMLSCQSTVGILLYKRVGGTYTELATNAATVAANTWYDLEISVSGQSPTKIVVKIDGVERINYSEATTSNASGGIALGTTTIDTRLPNYFDDVRVRPWAATEPSITVGSEESNGETPAGGGPQMIVIGQGETYIVQSPGQVTIHGPASIQIQG